MHRKRGIGLEILPIHLYDIANALGLQRIPAARRSCRKGEEEDAMREPNRILTARDLMATNLLTFRPDQTILDAISLLLRRGVSGGPVVDEQGMLVGMLSQLDCLRVLASDDFYRTPEEESARVADYMSPWERTIPPDLGIYAMAHYFLTTPVRRLPVALGGRLIGLVSRRDVLRGMEEMSRKRIIRQRYPDYLKPAENVGARRARL
jgi:CBS domain-containing protein